MAAKNLVDQLEDLLGDSLYDHPEIELELRALRTSLEDKDLGRQRVYCNTLEGILHTEASQLRTLFGHDVYERAVELVRTGCEEDA